MKRSIGVLLMVLGMLSSCKKDSAGPAGPPPGTVGEVEPNDATAQALGALGTTDISVIGSALTDSDVDKYSVSLGATTNLHAEVAWVGAGDLDVGIMNTSGIMVSFQRTGANPERCTLTGLPAGTYTVYVATNGGAGYPQAYSLKIGPR